MYRHKGFLERDCGVGKTSALCELCGRVGEWESELTRRGKVSKLASLGADAKTDRHWSDLTCLAGSRTGPCNELGPLPNSLDERHGSWFDTKLPQLHTIEDDGNSQQSASSLPQHQDNRHLDGTIFQAPESIAFPFCSASLIQWNATRLPDNLIRCMEVLIDAELSKVFSLPRPRSDKCKQQQAPS